MVKELIRVLGTCCEGAWTNPWPTAFSLPKAGKDGQSRFFFFSLSGQSQLTWEDFCSSQERWSNYWLGSHSADWMVQIGIPCIHIVAWRTCDHSDHHWSYSWSRPGPCWHHHHLFSDLKMCLRLRNGKIRFAWSSSDVTRLRNSVADRSKKTLSITIVKVLTSRLPCFQLLSENQLEQWENREEQLTTLPR